MYIYVCMCIYIYIYMGIKCQTVYAVYNECKIKLEKKPMIFLIQH